MISDMSTSIALLESFFENAFQTENPVKMAKADPSNILIAAMENTYFVDMNDIETYMEAADIDNIGEALNNIIEANDYIDANNICVMLDENTLGYSYDLDEIGCVYEAGMKLTDYPVGGEKLVTKIFTAIKSKASGIRGGKEASIAEYDKAIAKVKAVIDRIEEEREEHRINPKEISFKTAIKIVTSLLIKTIPALILITTGMIAVASKVNKTTTKKELIIGALQGGGIGLTLDAVSVGMVSALYYDEMLDQAKDYCEDIIKDLEKAKIANK